MRRILNRLHHLATPVALRVSTVVLLLAAASAASAESLEIPLDYRVESIRESLNSEGAQLRLGDLHTLHDYGQPLLPMERVQLLLPRDRRIASVRVEGGKLRSLGVPTNLAVDRGEAVVDAPLLRTQLFEPAVRDAAAQYPPVEARVTGHHFLHGYKLGSVEVFPMRLDSSTGELQLREGATLIVELEPVEVPVNVVERWRKTAAWSDKVEAQLRRVVSNPEAIDAYLIPAPVIAVEKQISDLAKTPSISSSPVDMIIVTTDALALEFQQLADHRTALGLSTVVVTVEYIQANFRHGVDLPETIRLYISDAYTKWGVDYVLLGGDVDQIPARYAHSTFYPSFSSTDIPSDLYYACLDGNWNDDGDGTFGEVFVSGADIGDQVDLSPELAVGRAPVSTPAAAQVFVDKVIEYEIPTNVGYQTHALFAAEVLFPSSWSLGETIQLDGAVFSEDIINNTLPCDPYLSWTTERHYENFTAYPGAVTENKPDILNALNSGTVGQFNHIGHGFYFNMSAGEGNLIVSDTNSLTNAPNYYVLYALNCSSAAFDFNCILERFMQSDSGGSVASIGSARSAFPNNANNYQQEFYNAFLCEGIDRIGDAVNDSRLPFSGNTFFNTTDRWTHFVYNALADPAMRMWTTAPRNISLSTTASTLVGPNSVTVTVTDVALAAPFEGVTIAMTKAGEDRIVGVTDALGQLTVSFDAETAGDIVVWASGAGSKPATTTIPVLATAAAFLSAESLSFDDDATAPSIGNANGRLEAGERLGLSPLMRNSGVGAYPGGTVRLRSDDIYISVVDSVAALGALASGASTLPSVPFSFDVDGQMPDGHEAVLRLVTDDGGAGEWVDLETILFAASEFEVLRVVFDDTNSGNGSGVVEPLEQVEVYLQLKNYGAGAVGSVTALLTSTDPDVTILDGTASFGAMPGALDTVDNSGDRFLVSESDTGNPNDYTVTLTDDAGRVFLHTFDLVAPAVVTGLASAPVTTAGITIVWTEPSGADHFGYRVYRRAVGAPSFDLASPDILVTGSVFSDLGLAPLTNFEYAVSAVDTGLLEGPMSSSIVASTPPSEISCFPLPMEQETSSDVAIAHVDGDGIPDMIIGTDLVYVIDGNCDEKLDGDANAQTFGPITGLAGKYGPASIAIANFGPSVGDEIVASSWGTGEIYLFDELGNVLPGWPVTPPAKNWGTPAVGDLDGDGDLEIVFIDTAGYVNAFHHDGTEVADGDSNPATLGPIAPQRTGEGFGRTSPALFDVDNNGSKEILFGSKFQSAVIADQFYAIQADGSGTNAPGWPKTTGTQSEFLCSPTVADLDANGVFEIIVLCENDSLYVWEPDGSNFAGFPKNFTSQAVNRDSLAPSIAVGDFTENGDLEMVVVETIGATNSRVSILDLTGTALPGWPVSVGNLSESSPVVGDITGDGLLNVVFGIGGGSDSAPNGLYAWNLDGSVVDGFPIVIGGFVRATPTITDFNLDGNVNIVLASWDKLIHVWDMEASYDELLVPYPTFRGNVRRDGVFLRPTITAVPEGADTLPRQALLRPNTPNPFNPSTLIRFDIPAGGASEARLEVFDASGRLVRTLFAGGMDAGSHELRWNGRDAGGRSVASGIYFARLRVDGGSPLTRKMALLK